MKINDTIIDRSLIFGLAIFAILAIAINIYLVVV